MALSEQKLGVFAQVAAMKVLAEDIKSNKQNLWQTLQTVSKDPIEFLMNLIEELIGYEALRDAFSDTMVNSLGDIEDKIKYVIKDKLKDLVSCGVNPELPYDFKYTGVGYDFKIKNIDFTNIFKLDPASTYGSFVYYDIPPQTNSSDLNTMLYYSIQDDGTEYNWGSQVGYNNITAVKFNSNSGTQTNIITIKASEYYSNNKKLGDWNNDYVDSLTLFPDSQFFVKVLDETFNILSTVIQKTPLQAEQEEKLNAIVDKLLDTEPDEYIDDSFFNFSNIELQKISDKARLKSLGINKLNGCYGYIQKTLPAKVLTSIESIESSLNIDQKTISINKSIDNFANDSASLGDDKDKYNIKLNFFVELIRGLMKSIVNILFSPKMILLFLVNYRIVQGNDAEVNSIDELVKSLKGLVKSLVDTIKGLVVSILLEIAMKEIKNLQKEVNDKILKELVSNKQKVLLSLIGVPQDTIRLATKF